MEIYSSQYAVMMEAITKSGIDVRDIAAIGITNQRETTILWDKNTGRPIHNAIVWQCRRTAGITEALKMQGLSEYIREATGLVTDAYFSGTKIKWILDHAEGAREKAARGEVLFGTVDSWLVWKLTGGEQHVTDYTNASRTMIYNIKTLDWDDRLLSALDIPRRMLPVCTAAARCTAIPRYRACASLSRASPATSRRRCSGRHALRAAKPRTHTAPAASC